MISISLDRCKIKEITEACQSFVEEINEFSDEIFSDPDISLSEAESRILEAFCDLRQMFLEMFISLQASKMEGEPVDSPECGQVCRPRYKRERRITTLCGVIRVKRWVYYCGSGHYHSPWEAKQKLRCQYTHRVAEAMCRLAALLDYREAASELSYRGIEVSHTTLQQKVCEWSEDLNVCEQVETQELEDNQRWYMSCDGCHTNSLNGWKETKEGSVYRDYPQCAPHAKPNARETSGVSTLNL